jgi:hypothetical protein
VKLFIDNNDGYGLRDYTTFHHEVSKVFTSKKNEPSTTEVGIVEVPGVPGWAIPSRGARVRIEDDRWQSRVPGVPDGVVWTGFLTEEPDFTVLGVADRNTVPLSYRDLVVRDRATNYFRLDEKQPVTGPYGFNFSTQTVVAFDIISGTSATRIDAIAGFDASGAVDGNSSRYVRASGYIGNFLAKPGLPGGTLGIAFGATEQTFEGWINVDELRATPQGLIQNQSGLIVGIDGSIADGGTGCALFQTYDGLGSFSSITGTTVIEPGKWYYIVAVKHAGGRRLYVNGVLEAEDDNTSDWTSGQGLRLGIGGTRFQTILGYVDDVAFYEDIALSEACIEQHWAARTWSVDLAHTHVFGFNLPCTSDDYLFQKHQLPAKTFINNNRGDIIKSLIQTMFNDVVPFPWDLSNIYPGGIERVFHVDPGKSFAEILTEFADADNYTYYCLDGHVVYAPEGVLQPHTNDPLYAVTIDEQDPRFTPEKLQINRVSSMIANDVTVLGEDEGTALVREHFVSNGADPFFELATTPFGTELTTLIQDDLTNAIDTGVWEESDGAGDYIRPFQGSLNIIGGTSDGKTYLIGRKGIELAGIIYARDGEFSTIDSSTGEGWIGGMYTEADGALLEANLFSAWYVNADTHQLVPVGPTGRENASAFTFIANRHYILRRVIEVDRATRSFLSFASGVDGNFTTFSDTDPVANATITWSIESIDDTDVHNVVKTTTTLLRKSYNNAPGFVAYAAIVSKSLHCVMNFVSVFKPPQVAVLVDGQPILIGSYLDGGRATITADGDKSRLAWYAIPVPEQYYKQGGDLQNVVTIPPEGKQVEIIYRQKAQSRARVINQESITDERRRFGFRDNGVRQVVINAGEKKPTPRTSEECQFLAQAYLADRRATQYQGNYAFTTVKNTSTELRFWPMPGDLIPLVVNQPDGAVVKQTVEISQVTATAIGTDAYEVSMSFGPVNRFDIALRQLLLARRSSVNDPSIETIQPVEAQELLDGDATLPDDPDPFTIESISATTVTIRMASAVPAGVAGYEVRTDDTGWGQPNYLAQFTGATYTITRGLRDVRYFVRPFNVAGRYSRRSAMVRVVYPLTFTIGVSGIDGAISPERVTVTIPLPSDLDFAGLEVRTTNSSGAVLYQGNGVTTHVQADDVNVIPGSGRLQLDIPNTLVATSYTVWVAPYNIIREYGTPSTFTVTRPSTALTGPATIDTDERDNTKLSWPGPDSDPDSWRIHVFDPAGTIVDTVTLPGGNRSFPITPRVDYTYEVSPWDPWINNYADPGFPSASNPGDFGVPTIPSLASAADFAPDENGGIKIVVTLSAINVNWQTADFIHWVWSSDPTFPDGVSDYVQDPAPTGTIGNIQVSKTFVEVDANFYFKARVHNAFGWSEWSSVLFAQTGNTLDQLAYNNNWETGNPIFGSSIRLMPSGYFTSDANEITNRGYLGFNSFGFITRNLLNPIQQFDAFGNPYTIINVNDPVSDLFNGALVENGADRGFNGFNSSYYLQTAMLNSVFQFDPFGVHRTMINAGHNVQALLNGATVFDGSNRGINGFTTGFLLNTGLVFGAYQLDSGGTHRTVINGSHDVTFLTNGANVNTGASRALGTITAGLLWNSNIAFGNRWVNQFGGLSGPFLLGIGSMDDIRDGGTFGRTTYNQVTGGDRGFRGLDGNAWLASAMVYAGVPLFVDYMYNGIVCSNLVLFSNRVKDGTVNRFGIIDNEVAGVHLASIYRFRNGFLDDGAGFTRGSY